MLGAAVGCACSATGIVLRSMLREICGTSPSWLELDVAYWCIRCAARQAPFAGDDENRYPGRGG